MEACPPPHLAQLAHIIPSFSYHSLILQLTCLQDGLSLFCHCGLAIAVCHIALLTYAIIVQVMTMRAGRQGMQHGSAQQQQFMQQANAQQVHVEMEVQVDGKDAKEMDPKARPHPHIPRSRNSMVQWHA